MLIIGDVHGKIKKYQWLLDYHQPQHSIQVGDFGFKWEHDWHLKNVDSSKHKIVFGNHDYYPYIDKPHSLGNCSYWNEVFTIRGAHSIDQHMRTEGKDWFRNEELNNFEQLNVLDNYVNTKPDVVVSHDAPKSVVNHMFGYETSSTRNLLEHMFQEHRPKLWIFGHFHESKTATILGTRFECLKKLQTFKI